MKITIRGEFTEEQIIFFAQANGWDGVEPAVDFAKSIVLDRIIMIISEPAIQLINNEIENSKNSKISQFKSTLSKQLKME